MNLIKPKLEENAQTIIGAYDEIKDWAMDKKGYFLIRINRETRTIELGHCKKGNRIDVLIAAKTPQQAYFTAIQKGLLERMDHAAYLGKELEKAYLALTYGLDYVQDDELALKKE
ncbi:TPA: DUF4346 domain-containing protein [Candidatus Woesearchaeota archaeon]|nr:DUF4346 domain-containing protein [Candidatus Woesearchaeota archaeon]